MQKNGKIVKIISFLDLKKYRNRNLKKVGKNFINYLINEISFGSNKYAGFKTEKQLREKFSLYIFNPQELRKKIFYKQFPSKKILLNIENVVKKSSVVLPLKEMVTFFLFPTFWSFTKEKMSGSTGYALSEKFVHIYLHPDIKNQKKFLEAVKQTLAHEYNHAARFQYFPDPSMTLLDIFIFEGLAENFHMKILGGKMSPWAKSLKINEAKILFKKLKPILRSKSEKIYLAVFFENKKYPLWAGYSIGYQIVNSFIKKHPEIPWTKIIQMNYSKIFKLSGWI